MSLFKVREIVLYKGRLYRIKNINHQYLCEFEGHIALTAPIDDLQKTPLPLTDDVRWYFYSGSSNKGYLLYGTENFETYTINKYSIHAPNLNECIALGHSGFNITLPDNSHDSLDFMENNVVGNINILLDKVNSIVRDIKAGKYENCSSQVYR